MSWTTIKLSSKTSRKFWGQKDSRSILQKRVEKPSKNETKFYNMALLDIKLLDIEGIELLTQMHRNTPKMKVMITGILHLKMLSKP